MMMKNTIALLIAVLVAFHFQIAPSVAQTTPSPIQVNGLEDKELLAPHEKLVRENPAEAERIRQVAIQKKFTRDTENINKNPKLNQAQIQSKVLGLIAQLYTPDMSRLALMEHYREEQKKKQTQKHKIVAKPKQLEDLEPEQQIAANWYLKLQYDALSLSEAYTNLEFPPSDYRANPVGALNDIENSKWEVRDEGGKQFNKMHGGKNVIEEAHKHEVKFRLASLLEETEAVDIWQVTGRPKLSDTFNGTRVRLIYLSGQPTPVDNDAFKEWKNFHIRRILSGNPNSLVDEYKKVLENPRDYFLTRGYATDEQGHNASGCGWIKGNYALPATPYCDVNGIRLPMNEQEQ